MAGHTVIIFGPTGQAGSAAAITASELGANVILAMRDVKKTIPGLDAEKEKQGNFERVTADLSQPDTVREAVSKSGAEHAFIYLVSASSDHMKSTIEALKSAGIKLVVFLSSFTVQGDLKAITQAQLIPYLHAQVELNLTEAVGADNVVALRGGAFASNVRGFKAMIEAGDAKIQAPDAMLDCIVPEDIGRVAGTVLAKGPQDDQRQIYLYGPKLIAQKDTVLIYAKMLGKTPTISKQTEEEAYKMFTEERGIPPVVAKYMTSQSRENVSQPDKIFGFSVNKEDFGNVEKYSGKKPTTYQEWVDRQKE